jgi:ribosomal protein S18 acetylase RimI-like enzyme
MPKLTYRFVNDVFRGNVYGPHDIFTAESWRRFVRMHDLDVSRALFAEEDGDAVGAIAFAQRGDRAWLSVMGVLPAYRRRGYGRKLFGAAFDAVRASGAAHVELEVVQRNEHAWRMYESFGFERVGELYVWARNARSVEDSASYERHSLASVRSIARTPPACWQRDSLAVSRARSSALIIVDGAYAYVEKRPASGLVLDAGARDETSATTLLHRIDETIPYELTLLNEPAASPLTNALRNAGWKIVERQFRYVAP